MVFGSSVRDTVPLEAARRLRATGAVAVHVLDNWSSYGYRLAPVGRAPFLPDLYCVMDEAARRAAESDGVPAGVLRVTGQPALGDLAAVAKAAGAEDIAATRARWGIDGDRRALLFVSEPAEADQGADASNPHFRGYTERQVLARLCRSLQAHASELALLVLAHPRQPHGPLREAWERSRGRLGGGVLPGTPGRRAVLAADGVVGMASILLYEAWLLGKPSASLQPGLVRGDIGGFAENPGLIRCVREAEFDAAAEALAQAVLAGGVRGPRPELARHTSAPETILGLTLEAIEKRSKG